LTGGTTGGISLTYRSTKKRLGNFKKKIQSIKEGILNKMKSRKCMVQIIAKIGLIQVQCRIRALNSKKEMQI